MFFLLVIALILVLILILAFILIHVLAVILWGSGNRPSFLPLFTLVCHPLFYW